MTRQKCERNHVERESEKNYIFLLLLLTFYLVIVCWLARIEIARLKENSRREKIENVVSHKNE